MTGHSVFGVRQMFFARSTIATATPWAGMKANLYDLNIDRRMQRTPASASTYGQPARPSTHGVPGSNEPGRSGAHVCGPHVTSGRLQRRQTRPDDEMHRIAT